MELNEIACHDNILVYRDKTVIILCDFITINNDLQKKSEEVNNYYRQGYIIIQNSIEILKKKEYKTYVIQIYLNVNRD